jgi:hypothetical protein
MTVWLGNVQGTGEERRFCEAQKYSDQHDASKIVNGSSACRNSAPNEDGGRNVTRWSHSGEDNVTRNLAH